jgi:hypothetical protein
LLGNRYSKKSGLADSVRGKKLVSTHSERHIHTYIVGKSGKKKGVKYGEGIIPHIKRPDKMTFSRKIIKSY